MTTELTTTTPTKTLERLLLDGDLSNLNPQERLDYYARVCESLGLNPLTKPFAYIKLNGKLVLYALRDCTEQLRKLHSISVSGMHFETVGDIYIVRADFKDATGRTDQSTGAVPIKGLAGENLANAFMKAETKCKRRGTLSICGLGMLDETEVQSVQEIENEANRKFPRLRGAKAQLESPVVVAAEPAGDASGEADREVAGDGGSESTGRAGGSDKDPYPWDGLDVMPGADPAPDDGDAQKRKRGLETAIGKFAETWGFRPTKVRDDVKGAMLTHFAKEHFLDLTPEQYETVHGWLGSWARQFAAKQATP